MEINKVYNQKSEEFLKECPDNFFDLTVTSPPYDNLKKYNGYSFPFEEITKELYRTMKVGGVVVWVVNDSTKNGNESLTSFKQALYFQKIGFNVHDTMIWYKKNCFNFGSNNCYRNSFEYMFIFSKGTPKTINLIKDIPTKHAGEILKGARKHSDGKRDKVPDFLVGNFKKRDNIWRINVSSENNGHPAVFPEQIANDHIISWSNEGDLILDPFAGSGTTLKMAKINKRNYIGVEISKEYCKIIEERLKNI